MGGETHDRLLNEHCDPGTGGEPGLSQDEAAIVASLFLLMSREVPGDTPTARIDMEDVTVR